jgi:hypothetical protein
VGIKTRRFDNIVAELEGWFDIHTELGSSLGGVHFEHTGENVTECIRWRRSAPHKGSTVSRASWPSARRPRSPPRPIPGETTLADVEQWLAAR